MTQGRKDDNDKPRPELIPPGPLMSVANVLSFGARKYAVDNWQHVPNAHSRYMGAALRHTFARLGGEVNDSESGLPHLAHACCCLLFAMWFDERSIANRPTVANLHIVKLLRLRANGTIASEEQDALDYMLAESNS